jgi:hypothetical protein
MLISTHCVNRITGVGAEKGKKEKGKKTSKPRQG